MPDQPEKNPPQDMLDWLGLNAAPNWALARPLGKLFGALLVLIFFAGVAAAVSVLYGTIRDVFWSDDSTGPNLGAGALVTAILGAPFLIWGTIIRHQSLRYQKEGHMTDRISKAVEQLGAEKTIKTQDADGKTVERTVPNLEVRIGAILSLERIAQDSTIHDKGRDHVRVMEVLCAYVRNNSPAGIIEHRPPVSAFLNEEMRQLGGNETTRRQRFQSAIAALRKLHTLEPGISAQSAQAIVALRTNVRQDIQHAIYVIGNRDVAQIAIEHGVHPHQLADNMQVIKSWQSHHPLDADGNSISSHLDNSDFISKHFKPNYRINLAGVDFRGYDLSKGNFSGANFCGSDFSGTMLSKAEFVNCNFSGCRFEATALEKANLSHSNFFQSQFIRCHGHDANFIGASLSFSSFIQGILSRSIFSGCFLQPCSSYDVNLANSVFSSCDTSNLSIGACNLTESTLINLEFDEHSLFMANKLRNAAFRSTNFRGPDVDALELRLAYGDASVSFPDSIVIPRYWPKWSLPDTGPHGEQSYTEQLAKWRADPASYTPPPPP